MSFLFFLFPISVHRCCRQIWGVSQTSGNTEPQIAQLGFGDIWGSVQSQSAIRLCVSAWTHTQTQGCVAWGQRWGCLFHWTGRPFTARHRETVVEVSTARPLRMTPKIQNALSRFTTVDCCDVAKTRQSPAGIYGECLHTNNVIWPQWQLSWE